MGAATRKACLRRSTNPFVWLPGLNPPAKTLAGVWDVCTNGWNGRMDGWMAPPYCIRYNRRPHPATICRLGMHEQQLDSFFDPRSKSGRREQ